MPVPKHKENNTVLSAMKATRSAGNNGGVPADLLVCFPSRGRLALMPKPICSPSRPSDVATKRHTSKTTTRGHASPLFNSKAKSVSTEIPEPTSPKVTCAGQIKVRPKSTNKDKDKNWRSVMEEIEIIHHQQKQRPHWLDALGLKKDAMQFLGVFRGLRLNMQCFGSFSEPVDCSSDDDDVGGDQQEVVENVEVISGYEINDMKCSEEASSSATVFSKWFMVLEENQELDEFKKEIVEEIGEESEEVDESNEITSCVPPPNALLLMRCRSAPSKGLLKGGMVEGVGDDEVEKVVTAKMIKDEEKEKERLVLMSYAPDFFKLSTDIAKETWVVGSMDNLLRSRSWKR